MQPCFGCHKKLSGSITAHRAHAVVMLHGLCGHHMGNADCSNDSHAAICFSAESKVHMGNARCSNACRTCCGAGNESTWGQCIAETALQAAVVLGSKSLYCIGLSRPRPQTCSCHAPKATRSCQPSCRLQHRAQGSILQPLPSLLSSWNQVLPLWQPSLPGTQSSLVGLVSQLTAPRHLSATPWPDLPLGHAAQPSCNLAGVPRPGAQGCCLQTPH